MPRTAYSNTHKQHAHLPCFIVAGLLLAWMLAANASAQNLLWFEQGRPSLQAQQAVQILSEATADGLDPQDYAAHDLYSQVMNAGASEPLTDTYLAQLDYSITAAMQQFIKDLHFGRINPWQVHAVFSKPPTPFLDPEIYLQQAVSSRRLAQAVREAAPPYPLYDELRLMLRYYHELRDDPAWQDPLPPLPARKISPTNAYSGSAMLTKRLIALGDLPVNTAPQQRYNAVLAEGIKSFQTRHGLEVDGIIGKMTFPQLQVTPAQRIRQIELTMERLRWTPLLQASRMIFINIPEFRLRAYEVYDNHIDFLLDTKVVVGNALDTRTPVFDEDMRFIEFSPYWNIPRSIAQAETVPKLRKDAAYFKEQGLEFVTRNGQVITTLSARNLNAVMRDELRIRQRPGPDNALGSIKFIFPNADSIFLHDTPATQLFSQDRRDLSHGCIRVEAPVSLAQFVLQNDPTWDTERIVEAMSKGESKTIRLREPLPVIIAYLTAMIQDDGSIHFFPDIYGHDQVLEEALRQRSVTLRDFAFHAPVTAQN